MVFISVVTSMLESKGKICCTIRNKVSNLLFTQNVYTRIFLKVTQIYSKFSKFLGLSINYELISICFFILYHVFYLEINGQEHFVSMKHELVVSPTLPLLYRLGIIRCVGQECENEHIESGPTYYGYSIEISNCFFSRTSMYSGDGGAIGIYNPQLSLRASYTMFYNCLAKNGGAIFFTSSQSYLIMICANGCVAKEYNYGHFAYLQSGGGNQLDYISVSNCSRDSLGSGAISLLGANQRVNNSNSSMNYAKSSSGLFCQSEETLTSSHCTFSNNNVSESNCIAIYSCSATIIYANIVHNNSPSWGGVIYISGNGLDQVDMMYCIFAYNSDNLFYRNSGLFYVYHSFIDHSGISSTGINNSFTLSMTYHMQFFNSFYCNADIPLPQRTIDQTNRETHQETVKNTPKETQMKTPIETLMNTPDETPMNTPKKTSMITPKETLVNTPNVTPLNSPKVTLMKTPNATPISTPKETLIYTLKETLLNTPNATPMNTPKETLMNTPNETPMNTHKETLINTPNETPMSTPKLTLINTPNETPMSTHKKTLMNTPKETLKKTLEETPYRSYFEIICSNQIGFKNHINVILTLSYIYPITILMLA